MNYSPIIFLVVFFSFRYLWSRLGGKRPRNKSTLFIVFFRKVFELILYLILPVALSFHLIPSFPLLNGIQLAGNLNILGIIFSALGLVLMIWTRLSRMRDWGLMGDAPADVLVRIGAYKFFRHPYYIGAIFFIIGLYLQLNSSYIVLVLFGIMFLIRVMRTEDRELHIQFGEQWVQYKREVGIFSLRE